MIYMSIIFGYFRRPPPAGALVVIRFGFGLGGAGILILGVLFFIIGPYSWKVLPVVFSNNRRRALVSAISRCIWPTAD